MELTSLEIGSIKIMEPVTVLTDLLVAVVCFYAWNRLKRKKDSGNIVFTLYRYFFLGMGLSTTIGALIGHAFIQYLSFPWKLPGWILSMVSVALAERASIMHAKPLLKKQTGNFFAKLNIAELCIILFLTLYTLLFIFVEIHAVYGLLFILFCFELFVYRKTKDQGSLIVLFSVIVGILALITHLGKLTIHPYFNYLDLSHTLMAISTFTLYQGVKQMKLN